MSAADFATQTFVEKAEEWDSKRTIRWFAAGLSLHGPYFFIGFRAVDAHFGASTSWRAVASKTAIAQFVLFPPYLTMLFAFQGMLEGMSYSETWTKVQHHVPSAFMSGCFYWPVANGINFALVKPSWRVPYLAASAGVWNSYLSWTNAKGVPER